MQSYILNNVQSQGEHKFSYLVTQPFLLSSRLFKEPLTVSGRIKYIMGYSLMSENKNPISWVSSWMPAGLVWCSVVTVCVQCETESRCVLIMEDKLSVLYLRPEEDKRKDWGWRQWSSYGRYSWQQNIFKALECPILQAVKNQQGSTNTDPMCDSLHTTTSCSYSMRSICARLLASEKVLIYRSSGHLQINLMHYPSTGAIKKCVDWAWT